MVKNEVKKVFLSSEVDFLLTQFGVKKLIVDNMGFDSIDIYCDLISELCSLSQQFGANIIIDKVCSVEND